MSLHSITILIICDVYNLSRYNYVKITSLRARQQEVYCYIGIVPVKIRCQIIKSNPHACSFLQKWSCATVYRRFYTCILCWLLVS